MSKFIILLEITKTFRSVVQRIYGAPCVDTVVVNVDAIVLIEHDWDESDQCHGVITPGQSVTKVYMREGAYKYLDVRESVVEIVQLLGSQCGLAQESIDDLSNAVGGFENIHQRVDDEWWDKEWRESYGDGTVKKTGEQK